MASLRCDFNLNGWAPPAAHIEVEEAEAEYFEVEHFEHRHSIPVY